ncbi:MAG: aminotransferase class III-fold pyridoxal phosphate-dependent enzyme [Tolypothrix carrinoi HA7290-LM1]|jgi:glutamate-1-semialdehyde aminotransferase|nr:aminotransferase class III-fold pyridoxal phosphate-dependent enzyme [Tolypothrix carrinoi HA7290-LM1]
MPKLKFPQSQQVVQQVKNYLPGGVHYNFRYRIKDIMIPFSKGKGSRVWDLDGNEHLDLFCKFGALIVGHGNEEYKAKLINYMNKVLSVDQCDLEGLVCERIIHHVPSAEMVRFGLSGTESVQNAIRLARAYTGKHKFVRFQGHYHGNADNIMGGKPESADHPVPVDYEGDFLGTDGRAPNILQEQSFLLPWNDSEALENLLQKRGDEIGIVIMEPICINGGGILPQQGYLEKVRELCDRHHVALIFDEVITGFRVALGGAQSLLGVTPDITVFAKAMAGGALPMSAIVGKKEIMQLYGDQKVIHAGTFNGYPLGLAAVLATIELLENDSSCYERMGNYLIQIGQSLVEAAKSLGIPMVVQGLPNVLVFHSQAELIQSAGDYEKSTKIQDVLITRICKEYGIQFSPISRFYSNLLMDESDVSFFKERIGEAMAEAQRLFGSF